MPKAEGKRFNFDDESKIRSDFLEVFKFDRKNESITIETNEFSAVCPFSGLPDFAKLTVKYHPDGNRCVELKSFKYYLISFRNIGIYQEAATARIYDDLKKALQTNRLKVTLNYNVRGGIVSITELGTLE